MRKVGEREQKFRIKKNKQMKIFYAKFLKTQIIFWYEYF